MSLNKWIKEWYDLHEAELDEMMHDIWSHPETGLKNGYAAKRAAEFAKTHGFPDAMLMRAGQGIKPSDDPNTVFATYGQGKPVIAIVGELDALPGLGQSDAPYQDEVEGAGHGCGHNLIAGSCMGAACALRYAMEKEGVKGTLKLVEAPGEEVGRGKSLLAFDGMWKDCDACIMWHPGSSEFNTEPQHGLCMMGVNFEFHGKTAHATRPWSGRSALDAVQLMNMGAEFLREHVTKDCIYHYQITAGGTAPNIVPDFASVKYFLRSASTENTKDLLRRIVLCAQGAATQTETQLDYGVIFLIPYFYTNDTLSKKLYEASLKVPEADYTEDEIAWAKELYKNYFGEENAPEDLEEILPTSKKDYQGLMEELTATDASDMSYFCPTAHLHGGGLVKGLPGHHWTVTACAGTQIGMKGAVHAGKVLAQGALDLFGDEETIKKMWDEFKTYDIPAYEDVYSAPMKPEEF